MPGYAVPQYGAYGDKPFLSMEHLEVAAQDNLNTILKPPKLGRQRMRMNIVSIFTSLFVPWILFTLVYADVSFGMHYKLPQLCWGIVLLGVVATLCFGRLAGLSAMNMVQSATSHQPTWYMFVFLTSLAAIVLGPYLGNLNFWQNMQPYYDLQNLNDYNAVDPSRMQGQQMMDAGRVKFMAGASLDLSRAYAFQNVDTYCVAPITMSNPSLGSNMPLSSYDFWAVGVNCCAGNSKQAVDFKCGPFKDPSAHEGVRLMVDEQRAFFRLAVQQAEAAHMIKAVHPLFFHWTGNAVEETHVYLETAFRYFASGMVISFVVQLSLVSVVSYGLSKSGHSSL